MRLVDYLKTEDALTVSQLAKAIGVKHDAQIRQWQHGYEGRVPSAENCTAIERATSGAVTRRDLRPDDWERIWPELVTPEFPAPDRAADTQGAAA